MSPSLSSVTSAQFWTRAALAISALTTGVLLQTPSVDTATASSVIVASPAVTTSRCVPSPGPSVQTTDASPRLSVVAAPRSAPPPASGSNLTAAPHISRPASSMTRTDTGSGSACPARAH